jgi:hypothetical protein
VTEREGILAFFVLFTLLYVVISVGLVVALLRWPHGPKRPARLPGAAGKEAEGVA